jgi:hypothetical protein
MNFISTRSQFADDPDLRNPWLLSMPEYEPAPVVPSPGAAPPAGTGTVVPPIPKDAPPAAPDERDELTEHFEKLRAGLGPKPEAPGPRKLGGFELAAIAGLALMGAPDASSAMLRGIAGGHAQKRAQAREQIADYDKRALEVEKLATPYLFEKAAERRRGQISEKRLALEQQKNQINHALRSAQLALERFKWTSPSANAQLGARVRQIESGIRESHYRAQEALAAGRLDEYERHNRAVEDLTGQARALTRQQVDLAVQRLGLAKEQVGINRERLDLDRQKALQGDPSDAISVYKFVEEQLLETEATLGTPGYIRDPIARAGLEKDVTYYRAQLERLRPRIEQITKQSSASGMGAVGSGAERTYTLKTTQETLTSTGVQRMIREALASGKTRKQVRKALVEDGIDPARFGF